MMNKVIIVILVFLVLLTGGFGAYSYYDLSQQVAALSVQLGFFQQEQSARLSAASNEFNAFRGEAITRFGALEDGIGRTTTRIGSLQDEISEALSETQTRVGTLEGEIKDVTTEFSRSVMSADEVYQRVRGAIVRVSDGQRTVGSGFMLDTSGHVVTAYHVVERLSTIYVTLSDGRSSRASVTGSSQYSDVAILTLNDKQLVVEPPALADSAAVRIGESVVAIGHPFDLTETLTSGIISQTNRFAEIRYNSQIRAVPSLIQFDAAVNPGNSGGPLLNSRGEVIGLVVARVEPDRGDGIYYAVASNKVKRVAADIIEHGFFDDPWLGVEIINLTPKMAQDRALETSSGALVMRVLSGSPAEAGGIRVDDVIVAIDTVAVKDIGGLVSYLGEYKSPDELVTLTLVRNATKLDLSLKVGKRTS